MGIDMQSGEIIDLDAHFPRYMTDSSKDIDLGIRSRTIKVDRKTIIPRHHCPNTTEPIVNYYGYLDLPTDIRHHGAGWYICLNDEDTGFLDRVSFCPHCGQNLDIPDPKLNILPKLNRFQTLEL